MSTHIISLGAGVQSTTMLLMAAHGEIVPKPRYAIFADTGWEPRAVYHHLEWLKAEASRHGIEVVVAAKSNLRDDLIEACDLGTRFASIPFHIINEKGKPGMARRQCTKEYKIEVIQKKVRELLGYQPRQRIPKGAVVQWIGISLDEIQRMKPSRVHWIVNRHPLIEKEMTRGSCLVWLERHGYPQPPKSSCIGCPYHNNRAWLEMKRNDPEAWAEAVEIDRKIRHIGRFKGQAFLHPQRVPLDQVNLDENQMDIFDDGFINECEGMCGV
jgi:hypothetical protein